MTAGPSGVGGRYFVQNPGPTNIPDRVLEAFRRPAVDFCDPEFVAMAEGIWDELPEMFGGADKIVVLTMVGHGAWESALTNTVEPGDAVLIPDCGLFSRRWARMARDLGYEVVTTERRLRRPTDPAEIADILAADTVRRIRNVCIVHTETSIGSVTDLPAMRAAIDAADHPALFVVDGVCSLGIEPMQMRDWGIDVVVAASQKGLMMPPGLSFGSAAGQEIRAALAFGAGDIDAVELVGEVIRLGRNEYSFYNGQVLNHFQVNAVHGEGRAFLRAADQPYDIIQIFSNHSTSSVAAGAGAMDPTYLLTADAFEEYFEGLTGDGILHINHHIYPRMVTTAALGWARLGRTDFRRHVVVVMRYPIEIDSLPTVLVKMTPWTESEMRRLRDLYSLEPEREAHYEIVEDPLDPRGSYLPPEFYSGALPAEIVEQAGYRIVPTTDDRPYFNFIRRRLSESPVDRQRFVRPEVAYLLNSQVERGGGIPMDVIHLIVTGVVSVVFAFVFIGVPLAFSRVGREPWRGKASTLVYFSCLGAGFIILELTFIQKLWKFIGYPLYTYAIVLFTLLLAAGLGSLSSGRLRVLPTDRWHLPFVGTLLYGGFFLATHEFLFDAALGLPASLRMLIAGLYLFPIGFFMGMAFPLGVLCVERRSRAAVAWAWGMNGLFTVVGGLASVLLSIYVGFTITEVIALGLYGIALLALSRLVPSKGGVAA